MLMLFFKFYFQCQMCGSTREIKNFVWSAVDIQNLLLNQRDGSTNPEAILATNVTDLIKNAFFVFKDLATKTERDITFELFALYLLKFHKCILTFVCKKLNNTPCAAESSSSACCEFLIGWPFFSGFKYLN